MPSARYLPTNSSNLLFIAVFFCKYSYFLPTIIHFLPTFIYFLPTVATTDDWEKRIIVISRYYANNVTC